MTFTQADISKHLSGLSDSAQVIRQTMLEGRRDEETIDCMDRNVRHILIMCEMPHLRDSGHDLSQFMQAAGAGAAWITSES